MSQIQVKHPVGPSRVAVEGVQEKGEELHPIEKLLSNPLIRWLLHLLTQQDKDGHCPLKDILFSYCLLYTSPSPRD